MPFEWLFTYSVPSSITQALRLVWSLGEGSDSEIMANAAGTGLSSTGQYIELLTERAFRTFGSILELHTELGRLFGVVRRVTDLMLTLQQLQEEEAAESGHVSTTYRSGENAGSTSDAGVLLSCHDMDVVAPDGRCLAAGLTFKVCEKEHMLITAASSGSGKSALFRHLAQLWPIRSGQMVLTGAAKHGGLAICYVSQSPLVPTVAASLLEMVTYGCAPWSLSKYGTTNDKVDPPDPNTVANVLERCHLGSILAREGLDSSKRWDEVLSLGEQQCLAIARVVYHKPKAVVIDEGFSAVSSEIQPLLLQTLDDCGVTVVCITSQLASGDLHRFSFHSTLELGCPSECGWHLDLSNEDNADLGNDNGERGILHNQRGSTGWGIRQAE